MSSVSEKDYINKGLSEEELSKELERTLDIIEKSSQEIVRVTNQITQSKTRLGIIESEITRRAVGKINQKGDVKVTYIDRPSNSKKSKH